MHEWARRGVDDAHTPPGPCGGAITVLDVVVGTGGRARADALAEPRVRARGVRVVLVESLALGRHRAAAWQQEGHLRHRRRGGASTRPRVRPQTGTLLGFTGDQEGTTRGC